MISSLQTDSAKERKVTETTYEVSVDLYGIDQNKRLGGYMICIHHTPAAAGHRS